MSPRTYIAAALALTAIALNPQGGTVLASTVAPRASAQALQAPASIDLSSYATASAVSSQAAADQAYTNAQISALNTTLNSAPSIATFASAMAAAGLLTTPAQAVTLAPVQKVNNLTGNVVLPTYTRQVSAGTPVSTSNGNAQFTFATAFTNTPTCFAEVQSTATGYVFAAPVITSKDTTQVTMNVQAALKVLNISLGALTVWGNPPAGVTLNITCIAPV